MLKPSDLKIRIETLPGDLERHRVVCSALVHSFEIIPTEMNSDTKSRLIEKVKHEVWDCIYGDIVEELQKIGGAIFSSDDLELINQFKHLFNMIYDPIGTIPQKQPNKEK